MSARTRLTADQVVGFWAAWAGWALDGMDSFIFALVLAPALSGFIAGRVKEPRRWTQRSAPARLRDPVREILGAAYGARTCVNAALLTVAIIGLWAGTAYEPTAIAMMARNAGLGRDDAVRLASLGTALLSIGTILGCLALPPLAERLGRRPVLAMYFFGMGATILVAFGWLFYRPDGLHPFLAMLVVLGFFGGNFAMFSLWLPEQYGTLVRATAFAFTTSAGRFIGAGYTFLVGWLVARMGTVGTPVACTSVVFLAGLLLIPFSIETRGRELPE